MVWIWKRRGLSALLTPFSGLYALALTLRDRRFREGRVVRLPGWVVSVGNLTVGGTGKTPLVIALAERLQAEGHAVAVVSRGYRRKTTGLLTVSDGHQVIRDTQKAGDEPVLMATRLKGIPVIVGEDRIEAARQCIEQHGAEVLLLDDGFQHRGLHRDVDVVVIDGMNPFGNGRLLPAGPLREPISALHRAHAIVISRVDAIHSGRETLVAQIRRWTDAPVFFGRHEARSWIEWANGTDHPLSDLQGRIGFAFAGIGNPDAFLRTLGETGVRVADFVRFPDHHLYREQDLERLLRKAERKGAVALLTTEKDAVRLPASFRSRIPIYALRIDFAIEAAEDPLVFIRPPQKRFREEPHVQETHHGGG